MEKKIVKVGMWVLYHGSFGYGKPEIVKILEMEYCPDGDKYGEMIEEIPEDELHLCTLILSNKHWAYGNQVEKVFGFDRPM